MIQKIINYVTVALCMGCVIAAMIIHTAWACIVFPLAIVGILGIYNFIDSAIEANEFGKTEDDTETAYKNGYRDAVKEMQEKVEKKILSINPNLCGLLTFIDQIAKELEARHAPD